MLNNNTGKYKKLQSYIISESEYLEKSKEIIKTWNPSFHASSQWSLNPQKEQDIILQSLICIHENPVLVKDNQNYITMLYVCESSILSEECIDTLAYIYSGLFNFDTWNPEMVQFIVALLCSYGTKNCADGILQAINDPDNYWNLTSKDLQFLKNVLQSSHYGQTGKVSLNDKMPWKSILKFQKLSANYEKQVKALIANGPYVKKRAKIAFNNMHPSFGLN